MSHKATVWAIQQRGLKPATKIVLWFLCDRCLSKELSVDFMRRL